MFLSEVTPRHCQLSQIAVRFGGPVTNQPLSLTHGYEFVRHVWVITQCSVLSGICYLRYISPFKVRTW